MTKCFYLLILLSISVSSISQSITGDELVRKMHQKYYKAPCKTYTFSQKNTHYRNDTITGTSEWHEAVEFPDKFRINFGAKSEGNYVMFRHDSVFRYRDNKEIRKGADTNTLLLLIGGMYYREPGEVANRLESAGYNLKKVHQDKWNGADVYVLGADQGQLDVNQFWVDQKNLVIVRIIEKMSDKDFMDMRFESHQKSCNGFVETKVSFLRNGKLEQVEEYYDIKEVRKFPN